MTPDEMAEVHAAAFAPDRGWSSAEITDLLANAHVHCTSRPGGFALIRTLADEAEILTLAVAPDHRRKGVADALMRDWMRTTCAQAAFLEVAADNLAAQGLYAKHGFAVTGRRKAYYARASGPSVDALLMQAVVTHRQNT